MRSLGPLRLRSWLVLVAACVVVFGVNLGGARALTEHEKDVAGGARQMLDEGDWLVPRMGDRPWLEKPPLLHWLVAPGIAAFGPGAEWVVRVPSVVAGTALVLLVAGLVGCWRDERAGLVAGLVQCTSWYVMTYARLAEADILLASIVVAAIAVFVHVQGVGRDRPAPHRAGWIVAFWALIGASNLCKGPLFGAVMVLLPCLAWLVWRRDAAAWRRLWSPGGIALALIIALAWPAAMTVRDPSVLDLWLSHTLGRARGDIGYGRPWWYYLTTPWWQLLPWTFATFKGAGPSLRRAWRDADSADRFVWLWALLPIIVLSLSHGKHHHYLIHCLPAFTLVTTRGLALMGQDMLARRRDAVAVAWLLVVVVAPALLVAGIVVAVRRPELRTDAGVLGTGAAVTALAAGLFALRARPRGVFVTCLVAVIAAAGWVHVRIMPARDTRRFDRDFLVTLHEHVPTGALLLVTGGEDIARHLFYVQVPVVGIWEPDDVGPRADDADTYYVVGRLRDRPSFEPHGRVTVVAQSEYTRHEDSPEDRFTLLRVEGREGG